MPRVTFEVEPERLGLMPRSVHELFGAIESRRTGSEATEQIRVRVSCVAARPLLPRNPLPLWQRQDGTVSRARSCAAHLSQHLRPACARLEQAPAWLTLGVLRECSYIQIYMECVYDLLSPGGDPVMRGGHAGRGTARRAAPAAYPVWRGARWPQTGEHALPPIANPACALQGVTCTAARPRLGSAVCATTRDGASLWRTCTGWSAVRAHPPPSPRIGARRSCRLPAPSTGQRARRGGPAVTLARLRRNSGGNSFFLSLPRQQEDQRSHPACWLLPAMGFANVRAGARYPPEH